MLRRVLWFAVVMVIAGVNSLWADGLKFRQDSPEILQERLKLAPGTPEERMKSIRELFVKAGCAEQRIVEQPVPNSVPNLICTMPGKQKGAIVVGAAYDYATKGDEAQVQWATLSLLPALAESVNLSSRRFSLVLIAFGGHSHGNSGAETYLKSLGDKERKAIVAMIDLDHLGRTPLGYHFPEHDQANFVNRNSVLKEPGHEDTPMSKALVFTADAFQLDRPAEIRETPRTDAKPFVQGKIQAIGLHSPAYTILVRPGNTEVKQVRTAVDFPVFQKTYVLLCGYVLVLDSGMPAPA